MKKIRCPICRRPPESLIEKWICHIDFEYIESGGLDHAGIQLPGHPVSVEACCSCGYTWKLRGIKQITDLFEEKPPMMLPCGQFKEVPNADEDC